MHRTLFVAVYGEYPTKEILYREMLPFHIYEATGIEDYTILVDMTKEMEEDLELLRKSDSKEQKGHHVMDSHRCVGRDSRDFVRFLFD